MPIQVQLAPVLGRTQYPAVKQQQGVSQSKLYWLPSISADEVRFGGQKQLLAKYSINPEEVAVVAPPGVKLPSKAMLIGKLLEAHEHALKNKLLGNYSGRQYVSNMQLTNGTWGLATNIENSRDVGILCGERSALVNAWNAALKKLKLDHLTQPESLAKAQEGLKVKMMLMSSGTSFVDPVAGSPCSECQSWMATDKYFSKDTLIVTLKQDPATSQYTLNVRKLGQLLPYLGATKPSLTQTNIYGLPVQFSDRAKAIVDQSPTTMTGPLKDLMRAAKMAYEQNEKAQLASFSGKNTAAAFLFNNGKISSAARFDFTARWFQSADTAAAAKGLQEVTSDPFVNAPLVNVKAIAYYGKDPAQPSVQSLGMLAQPAWGGNPDTLIAVIEDEVLQVRTIRDYMTDIYISSFQPKEAKAATR